MMNATTTNNLQQHGVDDSEEPTNTSSSSSSDHRVCALDPTKLAAAAVADGTNLPDLNPPVSKLSSSSTTAGITAADVTPTTAAMTNHTDVSRPPSPPEEEKSLECVGDIESRANWQQSSTSKVSSSSSATMLMQQASNHQQNDRRHHDDRWLDGDSSLSMMSVSTSSPLAAAPASSSSDKELGHSIVTGSTTTSTTTTTPQREDSRHKKNHKRTKPRRVSRHPQAHSTETIATPSAATTTTLENAESSGLWSLASSSGSTTATTTPTNPLCVEHMESGVGVDAPAAAIPPNLPERVESGKSIASLFHIPLVPLFHLRQSRGNRSSNGGPNNETDDDNYDDNYSDNNGDNATGSAISEEHRNKFAKRTTKHRQWLYDRVDGTSRYNGSWGKPPWAICLVPKPVQWFPDLTEMNPIFERFGRIGCVDHEDPRIRRVLFTVALFCNFTSLLLTFLAALAMTHENFGVLRALSFTRGVFLINDDNMGYPIPNSRIDIGLRTVALETHHHLLDVDTPMPTHQILPFDEFCRAFVVETNFRNVFLTPEQCDECSQASFPIIFSLALSIIFTFPSVTTNFLRMWPNYDVNCQKFFGAVAGTISLLSSCYTWFGYTRACFDNFEEGYLVLRSNEEKFIDGIFHPGNFTIVDPDLAFGDKENDLSYFFVQREWHAGVGLIFVVISTLLKGVDSICNWMVPTPSITRDHNEQRAYEYLTRQERSMSTFARLQEKHRNREVHNGVELRPKAPGRHSSLIHFHRVLGIPDRSHDF